MARRKGPARRTASRQAKRTAFAWVDANMDRLSLWNETIWNYAESAWREYRSAAFYGDLLRQEGFEVEENSGGMPTAFVATFGKGKPVLASYAEYDAIPGCSQKAAAYEAPRDGVSRWAPGHTDPHSALGMSALGGVLAAKAAMERHGLKGTLKLFGEPAEKVCGSKNLHALYGYYDGLDAAISFHPTYLPELTNTTVWDTHGGSYWSRIYTFTCTEAHSWNSAGAIESPAHAHATATARAPGAVDAICLMHMATKQMRESMVPMTGHWCLNEAILVAGQATADNLPAHIGQIQYACRAPTLAMQERIWSVIERNAREIGKMTHCEVEGTWIAKTRPALPNHAIASLVYRNLELAGAPVLGKEARDFARAIQRNLGLRPMADPFIADIARLSPPQESEARLRRILPEWQTHYAVDDYVEYTWHCPTARLYVARPVLKPAGPGHAYPDWVFNALGGVPACIDPMIESAAKCIGASLVELLTSPAELRAAKDEFRARTGGGIGGRKWIAPLLPKGTKPPINFRWPEYVQTARGEDWWIPDGP
ncbi:MAG: amidohydrolase [Alphaproteobacteria bacterium]